jgi:hypothetical protein
VAALEEAGHDGAPVVAPAQLPVVVQHQDLRAVEQM